MMSQLVKNPPAMQENSGFIPGSGRSAILSHKRWRSRRTCAHLLLWELWNYNLLLNNHWQENVGSHQKMIPHIQGHRRSPSKIVGGAKSHLEPNPIPARDTRRAQTKLCVHQNSETPQRLRRAGFECLNVSCRGTAWHQPAAGAGALGATTLAYRPYGISPLGKGYHQPHHRASEQMIHKLQKNYTK